MIVSAATISPSTIIGKLGERVSFIVAASVAVRSSSANPMSTLAANGTAIWTPSRPASAASIFASGSRIMCPAFVGLMATQSRMPKRLSSRHAGEHRRKREDCALAYFGE
jgi:hypothetical protein